MVESNLHASAQNVIMLLRPAWQELLSSLIDLEL